MSNGTALATTAIQVGNRGLQLTTLDEYWRFAGAVVKAKMAPRSMETQEKVFIAIQMGAEVGLSPMQSIQNIAVIGNRPVIWGDAAVALVRRSADCEYIKDRFEGDGESRVAIVEGKRRGDAEPCVRRFGYADAKKASLLSKDTYKSYPDRMFLCRARAFVLRDLFADLLYGLNIAEEIQDTEFGEQIGQYIESGSDAPLESLDDATKLLEADDAKQSEVNEPFTGDPSKPTPEELEEYAAADITGQQDFPF